MIVVVVHLLHREVLLLTNLAVGSIFVFDEFELGANLTVILLAVGESLQPVADHVEAGVTDITVYHHVALVVRGAEADLAVCLELLISLFCLEP